MISRTRLWFWIYRGATTVLGFLPFVVASYLGEMMGDVAYVTATQARQRVTANMHHILGENAEEQTLRRTVRLAFRSYGRYWTELACVSARGDKFNRLTITFEGWNYLKDALDGGRGAIAALPHVGSWDVAGGLIVREGTPLTTVAEDAASAELSDFFVQKRHNLGLSVLALDATTASQLIAVLHKSGLVALVTDRDVVGDGIEIDFFDAPTRAPAGPAVLAFRSHADLIPTAVFDEGRGRYRVVFRPPLKVERQDGFREDIQRVTQDLMHEFESFIRIAPQNWHVFQPHWRDQEGAPKANSKESGN